MKEVDLCCCCGKELNPAKIVWLEQNFEDARFYEKGAVPEEKSQGLFPFGQACAKKVLLNGGRA